MPFPAPHIRLTGLRLDRGDRPVLQGIDLSLVEARVGLIGRNGSGKSTLIRAIAGLVAPDAGQVMLCGIDPAQDRAAALRHVGVLFQNPDHQIIFPTVIEEIAFGLRQQGRESPDLLAQQMLDRFGRGHWRDRPVTALSQGQRHLVCFLSVLAMQPDVILLDEPMAGLDLPTVQALQQVIAAQEAMVVHATHDLDLLSEYDRVIWIDAGRVAGDGAPAEVCARFRQAMTGQGDAFADDNR